jgi:hypothetical protein
MPSSPLAFLLLATVIPKEMEADKGRTVYNIGVGDPHPNINFHKPPLDSTTGALTYQVHIEQHRRFIPKHSRLLQCSSK